MEERENILKERKYGADMERKKKKTWFLALIVGIAAVWTIRRSRKKKKEEGYTMSEKHEYYKFL